MSHLLPGLLREPPGAGEHRAGGIKQRQVGVLLPVGIHRPSRHHMAAVPGPVLRDLLRDGLEQTVDQRRRKQRALVDVDLDVTS